MAELIRLAAANEADPQRLPRNIEAEAAFLGAILIDNRIIEDVSINLQPDHFFEPLHGRIFEQIQRLMDRNMLVTPVTLKPFFEADEAMRELRKGWYLGSDRFRDRLVNQIDAIKGKVIQKGSVSGAVVKAHKEADAERLIGQVGAAIGYEVERESLATQRKGIWQKALLAAMVKKYCAVSNEWIANRLAMGHPAGMSKVVKLYQESIEGEKMMTKHEKILKSKD